MSLILVNLLTKQIMMLRLTAISAVKNKMSNVSDLVKKQIIKKKKCGFLSRTFTNHRTSGEGGGHFFNSSLPLPSASQTIRH